MTESSSGQPEAAKRRVLPVHPFLFAAFPLLALYAHNMDQVPLLQVLRPLGFAVAGTVAVWAILALLTRHTRKAAIGASAIVLAFFTYGHLLNLIPRPLQWLAAPLCILIVGVVLAAVLKTRRPLLDVTAVLNLASIVLLAPSCWTIGMGFWKAGQASANPGGHTASVSQPAAHHVASKLRPAGMPSLHVGASSNLPDVYYIILDAYGRADTLKSFYGYDNTPFLRALESRGFYVARHSRANYNQTPLCLASALNYTYLDDLAKKIGPSGNLEAARQMLDDNRVAAYLSKLGYRYVSIGCGVAQAKVETADVTLNEQPEIPMFEGQALGLTGLRPSVQAEHRRYDRYRNQLLGVFDNLDTVARLPYPKFVFAHVLAPHPPFVFGPNGEAVYPKGALNLADGSWLLQQITQDQYIRGYTDQLQYVNRRALEAVDAILKQSRRLPIIILQGDHGSRMNLNWDSLEKTNVREPFSIFNAYLVPRKVREDLYDTISPVNSFRIVLNDAFGAKYQRLPDRSFYSTSDQPFGFKEVTDRLARTSR